MIEWKSIEGYKGRYEVSSTGSIRNAITKQIRKNQIDRYGYEYISLRAIPNTTPKNHKVHRLVAKAFIENTNDKPHVNHIDGNRLNNNVDNLEWSTPEENLQHAKDNDLFRTNTGRKVGSTSNYHYVFRYTNNAGNTYYMAKVHGPNRKDVKTKSFNVAIYGEHEAEILAAKAVNKLIDSNSCYERLSRNVI